MSKALAPGRAARSLSLVTSGERRTHSEVELAHALMAGHSWALQETWYRLAPMVLSMAQRCLGSRSEAEDIAQEVFSRVFRKIGSLQDPACLRSFVYSFAVRVLKSELRNRRVRSWLSFGLPESPLQAAPSPDLELRDLLSRFYHLLDRLAPRDRLVFVMRRIEAMTVEEIAGHLAISPSTVKRSLTYSNRMLSRWVNADPQLQQLLTSEVLPL